MKIKFIIIASICCAVLSCNSNEDKKAEINNEVVTPDTLATVSESPDSARTIINRTIIWTVQNEDSGREKLTKPADAKLNTFSSAHLVQLINTNFPGIHLDFIKISHDTAYVKIPESDRLTKQIGSTGAENYMASATYTLTELKNVKFVNFAMKEGDHAGPGVFSREDFNRLR